MGTRMVGIGGMESEVKVPVQEDVNTSEKKPAYDNELLLEATRIYLTRKGIKDTRKYHLTVASVFVYLHPERFLSFDELLKEIYNIFDVTYGDTTRQIIRSFIRKLVAKGIFESVDDVVEQYRLRLEPRADILALYEELKEKKESDDVRKVADITLIADDENAYRVEKLPNRKYNIYIDLTYISKLYPQLFETLQKNFEESREKLTEKFAEKFHTLRYEDVAVYFTNSPRQKRLHDINSGDYGKFVTVRAVISALSEKKSFMRKAVYVCKMCGQPHTLMQFPYIKRVKPDRCSACGSKELILDPIQSTFIDYRKMLLEDSYEFLRNEESKEVFEAYMLYPPQSLDTLVGQTLEITVIVRNTAQLRESIDSTSKLILEVVGIQQSTEELTVEKKFVEKLIKMKKELGDEEFLYKMITTIDPYSLYSTDKEDEYLYQSYLVAKSVLLSYVSDKALLPNKTISAVNVLVVGDKGTNKTTFSRRLAELTDAVYLSATNMSKGGLIGIAEQKEGWGWVYRAGALLKAKNTALIIDEFDKIEDDDTFSSLLNVMSVGRFDYHKANIHIDMQLLTSIIALMNPVGGVMNNHLDAFKQIKIKRQEVLDRFALILFVRSASRRELDKIADKLVDVITSEDTTVGVDDELARAYLLYARSINPQWIKEANEELKAQAKKLIKLLSNASSTVSFSYGIRLIVHLRNIATAYAKLLLDNKVEPKHVQYAVKIFLDAIRSWDAELQDFAREVVLDMDKETRDALVYAKTIVNELKKEGWDTIDKEEFKRHALKYAETEADAKRILKVAKKFGLVEDFEGLLVLK